MEPLYTFDNNDYQILRSNALSIWIIDHLGISSTSTKLYHIAKTLRFVDHRLIELWQVISGSILCTICNLYNTTDIPKFRASYRLEIYYCNDRNLYAIKEFCIDCKHNILKSKDDYNN